LQHPGVVPVYELGQFPDRRPYFTMKLVKGRTLAQLLAERTDRAQDRPRFLKVFEQVCQALAYAHARGVIHRDLKPSNIMVGAFGEVMVMDWGLAKVLKGGGNADEEAAALADVTAICTARSGSDTQAGAVLGTPSHMAPEQARGEVESVDERADVFGLGAILCQVLTGQPPFTGPKDVAMRRAQRADLADAFARLDACAADAELIDLAKRCLAAEPKDRPRHAGELAAQLTAYLESVEARLRRAELERAAAEVQAREERKRRRVQLALAAAVLLLLAGGGASAWLWQHQRQARADEVARRRQEADGAVAVALGKARLLLDQGKFGEALAAAERVAELARTGEASAEVRDRAAALLEEVRVEADAAEKDRRLLAALLEVRGPREAPRFRADEKGLMTELAEPSADEQFKAAFRTWGLDVDGTPVAEAAQCLGARPLAVVTEVIAALDEWASERRRQTIPGDWQHLASLAQVLAGETDPRRNELRAILGHGRLPVERALGVLGVWLRPVPVPFDAGPGTDRGRLRQLAEQTNASAEPVLGLLTLVRALRVAGDDAVAERLLRAAVQARPGEVVLHDALGKLLEEQRPPRWSEAVECYTAARALRPELGISLAESLVGSGRVREGLALYERLTAVRPDNPWLHYQHGRALHKQGQFREAAAAYRSALALDPKDAKRHYNLGLALYHKKDVDGAIAAYRTAIALDPKDAMAHINLGIALAAKKDPDGEIAAFRTGLALDPKLALAHYNLGVALYDKKDVDGAIAAYRTAIALDPKDAKAHNNLGNALRDKKDLDGAIAAYRTAIALEPKHALAHINLGLALAAKKDPDGAIAAFRTGLALDPKDAKAHYNLGVALYDKKDVDGAIAAYRTALALDPKDAKAHNNLGAALRQEGRGRGHRRLPHRPRPRPQGRPGPRRTRQSTVTARALHRSTNGYPALPGIALRTRSIAAIGHPAAATVRAPARPG
jgi:tetratricopeptide (TPR) repeat protein